MWPTLFASGFILLGVVLLLVSFFFAQSFLLIRVSCPSAFYLFVLHGVNSFSLGFVSHGVFSSCRQALEELIRHQQGAPFAAPVDPARDRCPDYLAVIEQPMDLG